MKSSLAEGLTERERVELDESWEGSVFARKQIKRLLLKKQRTMRDDSEHVRAYENANWASYQAHCNGYCQAMREIIALL